MRCFAEVRCKRVNPSQPPPLTYPDAPVVLREKVSEGIIKQKEPRQVAQELVSAAREAGSGDDITAVVAKLG